MWPRLRGEADILQAGIDPIQRAVLDLIVELHVFFAADDSLIDNLIVERHHERVLELHAIAPDVGSHISDIDDVFAVRWQIDFGENTSASAERKSLNVGELRAGSGAESPT